MITISLCPPACVRLCLSHVGVLSKRKNESSCFWHGSFLQRILHRVLRKSEYLQNKGTSLWNFAANSGLRKFRHGKLIVLSTKLVDGRACGSRRRRSTPRCWTHIVYYTSFGCNPLTPLLRFVLDLLSCYYSCAAVDKLRLQSVSIDSSICTEYSVNMHWSILMSLNKNIG